MWLEKEKFQEIDHVVVKGEGRSLSRLLSELFHPENQKHSPNPKVCPTCQKTLVRKMHPYLEYFFHVCPDRHGAWMSPEVSDKLKQMVGEQILAAAKKKNAVRFLAAMLAGFILMSFLARSPQWMAQRSLQSEDSKIGADYWPARDFSQFPALPVKESGIDDASELLYLTQVLEILEEGASNRLNIEAVLRTKRSEENYWAAFGIYQRRQMGFINKLQLLSVPDSLKEFHENIQKAAEAQMAFYAGFTDEKVKNHSVQLKDRLNQSTLQVCNRKLLAAFEIFKKQYPLLDLQTREAVEKRLCWFDIV